MSFAAYLQAVGACIARQDGECWLHVCWQLAGSNLSNRFRSPADPACVLTRPCRSSASRPRGNQQRRGAAGCHASTSGQSAVEPSVCHQPAAGGLGRVPFLPLCLHCGAAGWQQGGGLREGSSSTAAVPQGIIDELGFPWGPAQFLAGLRCNLCLYLLAQRQIFPTSDLSPAKCQPCRCSAKTLVPGWWHRCTV